MFRSPGKSIQFIAKVTFVLICIGAVVTAFMYARILASEEVLKGILYFLLFLAVGIVAGFVICIPMYGFGALVDSSEQTAANTRESLAILRQLSQSGSGTRQPGGSPVITVPYKKAEAPAPANLRTCPYCGNRQKASLTSCEMCGRTF